MYNELILSVQKFKESSPDTEVIPDEKKIVIYNVQKNTEFYTYTKKMQ